MKPLSILLLSLALLLTGCGGASSGKQAESGPRDAKSSTTSAPEPEPIMLGTQRYTSPCRLLTPEDLVAVYGDPGAYATYTQKIVEKTVPAAKMRDISQTVGGGVGTECLYSFDNKARTTLTISAKQYESPARAQKEWRGIKRLGAGTDSKQLARQSDWDWLLELARENEKSMGGKPVRGLDPTILFVNGHTEFVGVRKNLVIRVSQKDYAGQAFEPKQIKGTVGKTQRTFDLIYAHAEDPELDQAPLPSYWTQPDGWTQLLDACRIFDDRAMVAATDHAGNQLTVDDGSTFRSPDTRKQRNSLAAFQAVDNTCERNASVKRKGKVLSDWWHGSGEIWYAAPDTPDKALLDGLVNKLLFPPDKQDKYHVSDLIKGKVLRAVEVEGADAAYLFDYTRNGNRVRWLLAATGPYVVEVDATRPSAKGFLGMAPMDLKHLAAAATVMVENVKTATEY